MTEVLDMADTLAGFADRLRTLRKQKNLSQTELGQQADCTTCKIACNNDPLRGFFRVQFRPL